MAAAASSPRRVLLACDWFLKYVGPFAEALARAGADVAVLFRDHAHEFGGSESERREVLDGMAAAGVTLLELPGRSTSLTPAVLRAMRQARRFRPDVVHAQSEIHDLRLLLATLGPPLALMVHDPELHVGTPRRPLHLRAIAALWQRRADLLLAHGERLAHDLGTRKPVRIIPHGMVARDAPLAPPAEPTLLLFGRLEYYKGVRLLLAAMPHVWAERPEVRLIVAGRGSEVGLVPTDDPRISLDDRYIPEEGIDELFARASLAVLPYLDASQSGVGLVALGRGVPIVVTDVGELPSLVRDPSFVAPPNDPVALAGRLLAHLDHDLAFRRAVLDDARAAFGWDAVAQRALRIYDELAAARGSQVAPAAETA